eukprot:1469506-Rhodomonas_salina.1
MKLSSAGASCWGTYRVPRLRPKGAGYLVLTNCVPRKLDALLGLGHELRPTCCRVRTGYLDLGLLVGDDRTLSGQLGYLPTRVLCDVRY